MAHATTNFRFNIRAIRDNPQRYYVHDGQTDKYIVHTFGEVQSLANIGLLNEMQYRPPLAGILEQAIIPEICAGMEGFGVCVPFVAECEEDAVKCEGQTGFTCVNGRWVETHGCETDIIPPPKQKRKQLDITLKSFLPNAYQRLNLDEVFTSVFNFLPLGWNVESIKLNGNILSIVFIAEGTPALIPLLAPIVAALMPLLIVIGIVIIGFKLFDLLTKREETKQIIEKTEIATQIESNKDALIGTIDGLSISDDQKTLLIKRVLEGDVDSLLGGLGGGFTGNIAIIIALIAVGGLVAYGLVTKK